MDAFVRDLCGSLVAGLCVDEISCEYVEPKKVVDLVSRKCVTEDKINCLDCGETMRSFVLRSPVKGVVIGREGNSGNCGREICIDLICLIPRRVNENDVLDGRPVNLVDRHGVD